MNINKARTQVEILLNDLIVHETLESDPVDVSTTKGWYDVKFAVSAILDLLTPVEDKTSEAALIELREILVNGSTPLDFEFDAPDDVEVPTVYAVTSTHAYGEARRPVANLRLVIEEI